MTRRSVPLSEDDLRRIERLGSDDTSRRLLERHLGVASGKSESALLHALLVFAIQRLEEAADEAGYQELAETQDNDDRAFHTAMRTRRRAA